MDCSTELESSPFPSTASRAGPTLTRKVASGASAAGGCAPRQAATSAPTSASATSSRTSPPSTLELPAEAAPVLVGRDAVVDQEVQIAVARPRQVRLGGAQVDVRDQPARERDLRRFIGFG